LNGSLLRGTRGGTLWIEPKDGFLDYYDIKYITDISAPIYKDNEEIGNFSKVSKKLYINAEHGMFIGYCKLN